MNDLKRKRAELKKIIDDIKQNPNKFTPKQVDDLVQVLDDQNTGSKAISEKQAKLDKELDDNIEKVKRLISSSDERKDLNS